MTSFTPPPPALSTMTLPRARELTDALLAPVPPTVAAAATEAARRLLIEGSRRATFPRATRRHGGAARSAPSLPTVRIGAFQIARVLQATPSVARPPFRWSPLTVRRAIGLQAVQALVAGDAASPSDAVGKVLSAVADTVERSGGASTSYAAWLATVSAPGRTIVHAEATTWATRLWTALEWHRIPTPVIAPPDRWWEHRAQARIALRGRADLRLERPDGSVAFSVLGGSPSPHSRTELLLVALVDALAGVRASNPSRLVGWWPECGRACIVTVDEEGLAACAAACVRVVERAFAGAAVHAA